MMAGVSTLAVFGLILVPLCVTAYLVAREALAVMAYARTALDDANVRNSLLDYVPAMVKDSLKVTPGQGDVEKMVLTVLAGSAGAVTGLLAAGTEFVVDIFLMVVAMYYFFYDGRRLVAEVGRLMPIENRYFHAFTKEFKDVAYAIMYGNSLTALVQGAIGLVGLYIAGVPHAPVWGLAMTLMAMIPIGGTALVWAPIGMALIASGRFSEGVFLLGWGTFLVSTIDNVVRPALCGARMQLHPLLVFLSMFGGIAVFGMMGLLVGPLIASIFMAMVRIYRRDFLATIKPPVQLVASAS